MCNSDRLSDFYKGETKAFNVYLLKNGVVQNVTSTVSIKLTDGTNTLEKDASVYNTDGSVRIVLEASETDTLSAGEYEYEIVWVSTDITQVLLTGKLNILERI
jgi:hypothetical protein